MKKRTLHGNLSIILSIIFVWLSLQSFQCQSPQIATARQAIQQKDYAKARTALESEVEKNKTNGEAWYLLGMVLGQLGDAKGMIEAYSQAENLNISDVYRQNITIEKGNAWSNLYNEAITMYNRYIEKNDMASLTKGIESLTKASTIKPDVPEQFNIMGIMQYAKGDTTEAMKSYEKYAMLQQGNIDFALKNGLFIGMSREKFTENLGKPLTSRGMSSNGGDSLLVEYFKKGTDEVYVFSSSKNNAGFLLEGFRANPPKSMTQIEKERYSNTHVGPFSQLASLNYNRNDYSTALKYVNIVSALRPNDDDAQALKIQIYQDQGKIEEAEQLLAENVKKNPRDKYAIANYGMLLTKVSKQDEAISQFEKAIELDPEFDVALYNAAALLKNKSGEIQKEELTRMEKDKRYKANEQRYFPLLTKSADYFERYRKLKEHRDDLTVMEQIANIYEVTRDKARFKQILADLESIEFNNKNNAKYWDMMGGLYARNSATDKAEKAFKRADEVRNKK